MAYHWTFGKDRLKLERVVPLIENYIMERVMSLSPEIQICYLKNIFPNMLPNTTLDFIYDMGVTDHRHYNRQYRK